MTLKKFLLKIYKTAIQQDKKQQLESCIRYSENPDHAGLLRLIVTNGWFLPCVFGNWSASAHRMPPFGISLQSGVLAMLGEDRRVKIEQNSQA